MSTRRVHDCGVSSRNAPPPVTQASCGPKSCTATTTRVVQQDPAPQRPVSTSFPALGPITASSHGLRIDKLRPPAVREDSVDSDDLLEAELFGEDPSRPEPATQSLQATLTLQSLSTVPSRPKNPEDILWEFYRTRNRKPSYEERVELSKATGWLTETIAQWFTTKRCSDPASPPASPSKTHFFDKAAARKPRTTLQREQIKVLEGFFEQDAHPDAEERARIAAELAVPSEAVYNWYAPFAVPCYVATDQWTFWLL
ncbi:hypothetical protein L226DRAFT_616708 [Lentinus tigrinus ALCF2SS1-7]|uniref:Homeobox domain-containing protein n=1 Tax=Lentinus tigrinus ALCF2SS1-6 TaxID=1328759 RepID=A0A5C2RRY5_9APHY|nr:hypothetical protein L227DRAFT_616200 [Lentinus tigrinus ALCF2SS1-6]RPD69627.1 hypothetical protein L226DRAFT_616708 [Lentinus tigrinus ALCF2SS1-7]